jgi:hypothetical protein
MLSQHRSNFLGWYYIQHCFICRPSDSAVPTDAGIEKIKNPQKNFQKKLFGLKIIIFFDADPESF